MKQKEPNKSIDCTRVFASIVQYLSFRRVATDFLYAVSFGLVSLYVECSASTCGCVWLKREKLLINGTQGGNVCLRARM